MQMQFIKERIGKLIEYIGQGVYPLSVPVTDYRYKVTKERYTDIAGLDTSDWQMIHKDHLWGGHREYYWFETTVTVPEEFAGKCVVFELKTGAEGGWDALNPQFSIYMDGRRVQGLDVNHREIIISENARAGETHRLIMSAFTGDTNYHLLMDGALKVLDRATEHYYYDIKVPYDAARLLNEEDAACITILQCLNDSLNLLDMREEGSEAYYESLARAQEYLTTEFYEKRCDKDKTPVVCCVGHTHIDCAWLWTLAVTQDKAVRSFSTVLELMRRYPEYVFMSSQPQLYDYVKRNAPEVYEGIKERVKEGRWEIEGGTWVEPDCNLTSGESLARQFLLGKRFFQKEFGVDCKILWLPDVFGYSAALPQIMQLCGVTYFMTTKISWNETNEMPMDTFMWEGIDGTQVLTHFIPTRDYNKAAVEGGTETEHFTTYNGFLNPTQMKGAWARYNNKDLNDEVLCSYGFGDGGGGPTSEQLENQRRMAQGIPGLPRTTPGVSLDFFKRLEADTDDSRYLPTWKGELYLEYHRGTYTTMARNKRFNRKSEFAYQDAELFAYMARALCGNGYDYPQEAIHEAWEVICRNQFHDILPGSSIKEVYIDSKAEYERILAQAAELDARSLSTIVSKVGAAGTRLVVFNPNSAVAPSAVRFEIPDDVQHPVLADGAERIPVQRLADGAGIAVIPDVPSKGYRTFAVLDEESAAAPITASTQAMENAYYRITFNDKGQFAQIYDKRADRNILKEGQAGNVIMSYEDRPHNYDAWDINNYYKEKSWEVDDVAAMEVVECGPVCATVKVARRYLSSTIEQYITIYSDIPRIDIRNEIDWKEHLIMMKDLFPIDVHTNEATFDIQFGNVTRGTTDNTSWDWSRFEVCHHKWLDVAEDGYGVSIMNDCKYGVSVRGTDVGLTMLKSALYPNPDADKEHHTFLYSIVPHVGSWRENNIPGQAYLFNNPLRGVVTGTGAADPAAQSAFSFVRVDCDNVIIDTVKKAEDSDDLIVRMYECWNRRSNVTMEFGVPVAAASVCSIMEDHDEPLELVGGKAVFRMRPYEIKTLKIRLQ